MEVKKFENNKVLVSGEVVKNPAYSHQLRGEQFYIITLRIMRLSGYNDELPIIISEQTHDLELIKAGKHIRVTGEFRSYNKKEGVKNHLILSIYAQKIEFPEECVKSENINNILLDGYICKNPLYRETPRAREITELMLAVNRPYGKSDYIPVICWGRNAKEASTYEVGHNIKIHGRIQSRKYMKKNEGYTMEQKTAYEVSADNIIVRN